MGFGSSLRLLGGANNLAALLPISMSILVLLQGPSTCEVTLPNLQHNHILCCHWHARFVCEHVERQFQACKYICWKNFSCSLAQRGKFSCLPSLWDVLDRKWQKCLQWLTVSQRFMQQLICKPLTAAGGQQVDRKDFLEGLSHPSAVGLGTFTPSCYNSDPLLVSEYCKSAFFFCISSVFFWSCIACNIIRCTFNVYPFTMCFISDNNFLPVIPHHATVKTLFFFFFF